MKKLSLISGIATTTLAFLALASAASADICTPVYGGQNCVPTNISVNKTVRNPHNGHFVDNLNVNDAKYNPGDTVLFHISVTNTGSANLQNITVRDYFPQYMDFVSGGSWDSGNRVASFSIDNLNVGETKTYDVQAKFYGSNNLPNNGITCVINQSVAWTQDGKSNQDNAQVCVQQQVLGTSTTTFQVVQPTTNYQVIQPATTITTVPATGPEAVAFAGLSLTGLAAFALRKYLA